MQIKSYNRIQLQEFIDSDLYKNLNLIPISYHRAISHIHNPDVQDDDDLLWAAYEKERLLGYVGVLPGLVHINQEKKRVFWLSCFWVDEHFRKENLASLLFFPLIKRYKKLLFISNFLPNLEKTYQRLGFFKPTIYKLGSSFYCKSCFSDLLPARFPKIKFLKPLLRFIDSSVNLVFNLKKMFFKPLPICSQTVLDENFDDVFQDFLHSFYKNKNYVERFAVHFKWILNYPWVLQGKADHESKRYYFSSKAKQFEYNSVKFFKNNKLSAFLLLKTRDQKLAVSYIFAEEDMYDDITHYLLQKVHNENVKTVTTFNDQISKRIRNYKSLYVFERNYKRPYILPKTQEIDPDVFQEGDGDNAFT
jgi:GNAT superfamily N-acetyltransferase